LANRMAADMFGYGPNELLAKSLDMLVPERMREQHAKQRAEFNSNPMTRPMGIGRDLVGLRKDGSEFPIEVSLSSVLTSRGPLAVSFVSDITARKQAEAALQNSEQQLRVLAGNLLTAQENERRRLSRELHDDIIQRLAFLSFELGKLTAEIPDSSEQARATLRTLQEQTLQASSEVRRISHGLHPSVIEDFGLSIALEEFCGEFEKGQEVRVSFEGLVDDSQLDAACSSCLYRIAQQSLRNAVTHGHATEVHFTLSVTAGSVQLLVKDNGTGFMADGGRMKTGLGVVSMKERIRLVNGTLTLTSQPGQGTEIIATVPLAGAGHE
jgi:PAS domain S-box-containing protein